MPNTNRKRLFVPEPEPIWLGQGDGLVQYDVVPAGWGALMKLKDLLKVTLGEVSELMNETVVPTLQAVAEPATPEASAQRPDLATTVASLAGGNVWDLIDRLLEKPQALFKLAIPNLDEALFDPDNPKGVTITQVWATFEVIMEVNKLDFLKNLIGGTQTPPNKTS
jgi:hypothetical protein